MEGTEMSNGEVAPGASDRRILWVLNASAAILVTVVFLLIVMTAIAQQDVIASIKQDQLSLGYSAALTVNNEARGINDELRGLRAEVRAISKQLRSDQVNFMPPNAIGKTAGTSCSLSSTASRSPVGSTCQRTAVSAREMLRSTTFGSALRPA